MRQVLNLSEKIPKHRLAYAARRDGLSPGWAAGLLDEFDRHKSSDRQFTAGSDLFSPGERRDAIYRLVDGWVVLYCLLEDGGRQILHFALPGAVLAFVPGRPMWSWASFPIRGYIRCSENSRESDCNWRGLSPGIAAWRTIVYRASAVIPRASGSPTSFSSSSSDAECAGPASGRGRWARSCGVRAAWGRVPSAAHR